MSFAIEAVHDIPIIADLDQAQRWIEHTTGALRSPTGTPSAALPTPQKVNQLGTCTRPARSVIPCHSFISDSPLPTDGEQMDLELCTMLRYQLVSVFKFFDGNLMDRFRPEIDLLLNFLIYRCSVYVNAPSPGNQVQNLRYRNEWTPDPEGSGCLGERETRRSPHLLGGEGDASLTAFASMLILFFSCPPDMLSPSVFELSKTQRVAHGVLTLGTKYTLSRLSSVALNAGWALHPTDTWQYAVATWLRRLETAYRVLAVLNFLDFLCRGRYRSLLDRLLGMRLVYTHPRYWCGFMSHRGS